MTPREFLAQFFDALNRPDLDAAMAMLHPDFTEEYPQSGERIRGRANFRAIIDNYPGGLGEAESPIYHGSDEEWVITPAYTVVRVTETGRTGTAVVKIRYADGSDWWMIALFELKDDLLYRQTTYYAAPFEAPDWRAEWVERMNV